ncbi:MAG: hypothetical protein LW817_00015 [Candidatus Caenarcaniphilales bacterium]|nr:hypothetical protein [Candidatus Caenarcaniphilales bacterium]
MIAVKIKSSPAPYIDRLASFNNALEDILEKIQDPDSHKPENLLNIQRRLKSLHQDSIQVDKGIWKRYSRIFLPIQTLRKPKTQIDELKSIELENLSSDAKDLLDHLFQCFDKIFSLETNIHKHYPEKEIPKYIRYVNTEVSKLKFQFRGILSKFGFTLKSSELQKYKDAANEIIDQNPNIKNLEAIKRDLRLENSDGAMARASEKGKELIRRFLPHLTTAASGAIFLKAETWYNSSLEQARREFDYLVIGTGNNRLNISEEDAKKMIREFEMAIKDPEILTPIVCVLGILASNSLSGRKFFNEGSTLNRRDLLKRIRNAGLFSAATYTAFSKSINSISTNNVYRINNPDTGERIYNAITIKKNDPKRDIEVTDEEVLKKLRKRCQEHSFGIVSNVIQESLRHGGAVASGVVGFYKPNIIEEALDFFLANINS